MVRTRLRVVGTLRTVRRRRSRVLIRQDGVVSPSLGFGNSVGSGRWSRPQLGESTLDYRLTTDHFGLAGWNRWLVERALVGRLVERALVGRLVERALVGRLVAVGIPVADTLVTGILGVERDGIQDGILGDIDIVPAPVRRG